MSSNTGRLCEPFEVHTDPLCRDAPAGEASLGGQGSSDLISSKRAAGRDVDLEDVRLLELPEEENNV
jgi:hypothetical protein